MKLRNCCVTHLITQPIMIPLFRNSRLMVLNYPSLIPRPPKRWVRCFPPHLTLQASRYLEFDAVNRVMIHETNFYMLIILSKIMWSCPRLLGVDRHWLEITSKRLRLRHPSLSCQMIIRKNPPLHPSFPSPPLIQPWK